MAAMAEGRRVALRELLAQPLAEARISRNPAPYDNSVGDL